jgi:phosphohistidine phosphatase
MATVYLIRHAEAVPAGDPNYEDDDRPLLDLGRRQARQLGAALAQRGIRFDAVLSSPLPRALATAEELLVGMGGDTPAIKTHASLAPGGKPRRIDRLLLKADGGSLAVVGHQPDLGLYAARLIGSKKANLALDKPGVACIECFDPPGKECGELAWLITRAWFGHAELPAQPLDEADIRAHEPAMAAGGKKKQR